MAEVIKGNLNIMNNCQLKC